jgi:cupin fold WbuC family metalloprotein
MMQTTEISPEVHYATDRIVNVGADDVRFLLEDASRQPRRRMRVCAHRDTEEPMQEMFIAFTGDSYLRPSLHHKDESLQVLEGRGTYLFFNEAGQVVDRVHLGDYESGLAFYCRIPRGTWHALVVESDVMLIHEITEGPFDRADTEFAPWTPEEQDTEAVAACMQWLRDAARGDGASQ